MTLGSALGLAAACAASVLLYRRAVLKRIFGQGHLLMHTAVSPPALHYVQGECEQYRFCQRYAPWWEGSNAQSRCLR